MKNINKVLFLNPPDISLLDNEEDLGYEYFEPPLGLLYVYDFIKKKHKDIHSKFFDLNIEMKFLSQEPIDDILATTIKDFNPDMIAIAAMYYSGIHAFHLLADKIKKINPKVIVTFGGHYPHHLTANCLADNNVDYAILSEGELGLSDLIDSLNGKNQLESVEGIAFRKNKEIVKNPRRKFWKGFSEVSRLPWEDTHFQYYFKEGRNLLYRMKPKEDFKIAAITASRGCTNQCTFCTSPSFWNSHWRKRKVAHIIDEISYLKKNYSVNTIVFNDENIAANAKWFVELLDELKKMKIKWISSGGFCVRKINDEDVIKKMYESGLIFFNLGVESGTDETLKQIKKPLTVNESENVIRLIREYGDAFINAFIVIGFPFEDLDSVKRTLKFSDSLDTDWQTYHCFRPLPGAELFDYCEKNNLLEGFEANYGELLSAPKLKYINYSSEELDRLCYLSNLRNNFVFNRNIDRNTEQSLAQAERDFLYVLEMAPNHVFALLGLAEIMYRRNIVDAKINYLDKAKAAREEDNFDWQYYLDKLSIDINKRY